MPGRKQAWVHIDNSCRLKWRPLSIPEIVLGIVTGPSSVLSRRTDTIFKPLSSVGRKRMVLEKPIVKTHKRQTQRACLCLCL